MTEPTKPKPRRKPRKMTARQIAALQYRLITLSIYQPWTMTDEDKVRVTQSFTAAPAWQALEYLNGFEFAAYCEEQRLKAEQRRRHTIQ